ncbi:hypothetical protein ATO12_24605 [Aquimarina atlantica]|uniref:Uncharacterized protein n=1 Tax=Aquimarina atlantica TaxID=1317122 RepID=A0A023BQ61_9FLAO|nr:hypothetical protein [Aquimarina atlantica]EZH72121.1 hypothetical protein ATO12_24605 [Aquimarina atlantica]
MLLIKKISKIIILSILLFGGLISCDDDSSDEEQIPEEIIIEDFANFKDDPKFLEYMEQLVASVLKVENADMVLELLEETELTDEQNIQLVIALGFETMDQMEENLNVTSENWQELYKRFDLGNQDKALINSVMVDAYVEIVLDLSNKNSSNALKNSKQDSCLAPCFEKLVEDFEMYDNEYDRLCRIYDLFTDEGKENERQCRIRTRQKYIAEINKANLNWACCAYWTCGVLPVPLEGGDGIIPGPCNTPIG